MRLTAKLAEQGRPIELTRSPLYLKSCGWGGGARARALDVGTCVVVGLTGVVDERMAS